MTGLRALVIAVAAALMAPAAAGAQPLLAITATNQLLSFDSATPGTVTTQSITGLIDPTQSIVGLDRRPATGQVYVVTSAAGAPGPAVTHLYALNPTTGQLAFAGDSAAPVSGFGDLAGGLDFNPGVDRLRVVNVNDANLRLNPNTGALAGSDTSISPTSDLVGLAYDVLPAGATASTVFAIDRATSTLVRLGGVGGTPSPNGGVLTTIGPLGVALDPGLDAGFDISPTGTPFVAATTGATTRLFTANLASRRADAGRPHRRRHRRDRGAHRAARSRAAADGLRGRSGHRGRHRPGGRAGRRPVPRPPRHAARRRPPRRPRRRTRHGGRGLDDPRDRRPRPAQGHAVGPQGRGDRPCRPQPHQDHEAAHGRPLHAAPDRDGRRPAHD